MAKKLLKVKEPRSEVSKQGSDSELIQALNKLQKSAWKQQRQKLNSEKYKEQFIAEVTGAADASD